ncbi:phosphatidylinositol 4-kinase [Moniliophthora roreri MCA 2997]|uniref:1-phosphatidylinositol 4-kinase n=2 Tax=Moniliophthora roreri TaxID=221103 RepID=V2XVV1_MONRO|nr:phosphatidylinositol 4-kinase [Moniliophthora roreri MCA 2997]KAI3610442.1 phosphatidylinositol 4-kinase [Moniliophthora roreri]
MSHALLLRLFLTPFFSVHVALQYLQTYPDNIGITYYITRRLRELDISELRDVWGFICHLLLTRPSKSRALECFVVDVSQRSTHIALFTLWFMQAALKDLPSIHHESVTFSICQRVLHKCHEIIFSDLPPAASPYATLSLPFRSRFSRKKVKHHTEPAIIGIGMVLAGTPALPRLTDIMGEVAIEQGRVEETTEMRSIESQADDLATGSKLEAEDSQEDEENDLPATENNQNLQKGGSDEPQRLMRRRSTIGPSQTVPALPLHLQNFRRSRNSEDPLGQLDAEPIAGQVTTPYQSSPSIPSTRPMITRMSSQNPDTILQTYDLQSQLHLLKSHYCRSEVQFILTLENIANRLLVVPRPARVSALRAELTSLNHKLPAEICMPMWCTSSDTLQKTSHTTQPHHRIVRIPPGECVVLNSAEKAPYLLYIEVVNDDLDFDPQKRSNKDVLKKIVVREDESRGTSREMNPFSTFVPTPLQQSGTADTDADLAFEERPTSIDKALVITPPTPSTADSTPIDAEEEMDLVDQLYGVDQSLRSRTIDLSESIVLPPAPKNKDLDMVAWSRPSSIPSTPNVEADNRASLIPESSRSSPAPHRDTSNSTHHDTISLDEYSERMRTAAIMLAQLNANLSREPIVIPSDAQSSGPLSWITGSNWLTISSDSSKNSSPNPSGSQDFGKPMVSRMRLQPADAYAIRDRIMQEMLALEEERMARMRETREGESSIRMGDIGDGLKTAEDESIIRKELSKADPSAMVFSESWTTKKSRIRHGSPYGHLANWDCVSVIVKTGGDLRQEQLAVQLIREFQQIWEEENCQCWVRPFRILITGGSSGLVETITDAVSIHSIKKSEYARRLAEGRLGHVTLLDHFKSTYGDPSSAKFARARRNFAKSLAGYSIVTYLLQIKDRHNGNILLDRNGHLIHIDFGFMLSNTPGNIRFEAAPFKLPPEYVEVLGGVDGLSFLEFKQLFREGFEAARKHCDRIITLVELMQKDSTLPCFVAFGEQTATQLRDRFQPALTHSLVGELVDRLIYSSLGSHWTRLYDSYQYYSQSIL